MSTDERLLSNPGILIVTGASTGIGAAIASLAARRGYSVCVDFLRGREAAAQVVNAIEREASYVTGTIVDVTGGR
ncbi:MAG: SDR family NAD(P)-dependent oxidoreductase [Bryobacteraceae bacterium]|jgi:NAD(P)-dependent dehydrogenase (short-subunit alcohol dehydrogenase family)